MFSFSVVPLVAWGDIILEQVVRAKDALSGKKYRDIYMRLPGFGI